MQFDEGKSKEGICPICDGPMIIRNTRNRQNTCGKQSCQSMARYATRYRGTNSGPMDRPNIKNKIKLP